MYIKKTSQLLLLSKCILNDLNILALHAANKNCKQEGNFRWKKKKKKTGDTSTLFTNGTLNIEIKC